MNKSDLRKCKWIDQNTGEERTKEIFLFHKWFDFASSIGDIPHALVEYSSTGRITSLSRFEIKFID